MSSNEELALGLATLADILDGNTRTSAHNEQLLKQMVMSCNADTEYCLRWVKSIHHRQWTDWREEVSGKRPGLQWRRQTYDAWKSRRA